MVDELQLGNSPREVPPLRIATVGNSPDAVFHLEAAAIRDELVAIVAANFAENNESTEPVPGCPVCSLDELTQRSDVDVVLVCGPVESRVDTAVRLLQNGKHVVVESSFRFQPDHIQQLINLAGATGRFCAVWRPRHAEADFRRAAQVVSSGEAGFVRAVRFVQHEMAAAMLPGANSPSSRDRLTESTLRDLVGHRGGQVLTLISEPVKSVTANFGREPVCFGTGDTAQQVTPTGDTCCQLFFTFESGATALIDVDLACPAPISTGWIVQGTCGGYHSKRQHITVEDGEIYDVAVELAPFDPYLNLHSTIRNWPETSLQKLCLNQLQLELEITRILQPIL
ncbi:MAG: Gfo/Idh/MocA family oxidoreductase [Rhodopirellula sp.]|nr:Gfo/Idh/MocA family oxidoreductase [Rhodopirellula sp.]